MSSTLSRKVSTNSIKPIIQNNDLKSETEDKNRSSNIIDMSFHLRNTNKLPIRSNSQKISETKFSVNLQPLINTEIFQIHQSNQQNVNFSDENNNVNKFGNKDKSIPQVPNWILFLAIVIWFSIAISLIAVSCIAYIFPFLNIDTDYYCQFLDE